jgi:endonuclease/exonuclease/phosphatase family metal-dependent hydrolase
MTLPLCNTRKCRRGWAWLAAAALLGGLTWHASRPIALGPADGVALEGGCGEGVSLPALGSRKTFRVGTFNIHGCKGEDDRRDVDRVAECLKGLDFVALQEVHGPRPWQRLDQAGELGQRLGMAWLFAPNTRVWHCLDSGNGLLSRVPVEFWQRIPLANYGGRGFRNAVLVGLTHRNRSIRVLLTHVSHGNAGKNEKERNEQLRTVISLYLALSEPAILLGDLNSDARDPQIRRLLATPGVTDAVGKVLGPRDTRRFDWIITRGLRCVDAGVCDSIASDHKAVWAELE